MITGRSWTEEEVRESILSSSISLTSQKIDRTKGAISKIRYDYKNFITRGEEYGVSAPVLAMFRKFKEEGLVSSRASGQHTTQETVDLESAGIVFPMLSAKNKKDPYTQMEIIVDKFLLDIFNVVGEIVQEAYKEKLQAEIQALGENEEKKGSFASLLRKKLNRLKKGVV